MNNLRVTVIQSGIVWHSIEDNLRHFGKLISSIESDTDILFLPEMFSTGFTMKPRDLAEDMNGRTVSAMSEWASRLNAFIAGGIIVSADGRFFNRIVITDPDGGAIYYDKKHLFRMSGEDGVYEPGRANITTRIRGWRVRPFICYDLRFPVWTRNIGNEYDVAFFAANWPSERLHHWETLLRARAIENQCYVVGVNRTGEDGNGVRYPGGTSIVDYSGNVMFSAGSGNCIHTDELSFMKLEEYRRGFPAWMDADHFNLL